MGRQGLCGSVFDMVVSPPTTCINSMLSSFRIVAVEMINFFFVLFAIFLFIVIAFLGVICKIQWVTWEL